MANVLVLLLMVVSALVPLALATIWMQRGKVGYPLTMLAVLGACLAVAVFGSMRPIGVDPLQAISAAMLVFLPGTLGCAAGALLGWLIYRRRHGSDA